MRSSAIVEKSQFDALLRSRIEVEDVRPFALLESFSRQAEQLSFLRAYDTCLMEILEGLVNHRLLDVEEPLRGCLLRIFEMFRHQPSPTECPVFRHWVSKTIECLTAPAENAILGLKAQLYAMPVLFCEILRREQIEFSGDMAFPRFYGVIATPLRSRAPRPEVKRLVIGKHDVSVHPKGAAGGPHNIRDELVDAIFVEGFTNALEVTHYDCCDLDTSRLIRGMGIDRHPEPSQVLSSFEGVLAMLSDEERAAFGKVVRRVVFCVPTEARYNSLSVKDWYQMICLCFPLIEESKFRITEGLIHETSHKVLEQLLVVKDLFTNAESEKEYYHPWMPGVKRPMRGVMLGIHAFVNVLQFYRRLIERDGSMTAQIMPLYKKRYGQVDATLKMVLEKASLTTEGEVFLDALSATVSEYRCIQ
ncbi:aKG-HExxH-type peptide beta-hydroxylase [Sorangium sp. So ce1335]|uniref:aKG-HExxH-type peptide beta-hydroxylase n=1 Tax=Sorangium sp. So ce1335 TaxID=3133335 RepID=UPI003F62ECF4